MSTKKDLVEAHSFNRRRLITAFISGAPGGREVEPVRTGRTLIGGLVLALLIVAGAAVAGFLKPTLPEDWKENGLVIGEESGSRFLAYEGSLYPIINSTSARLLLEDFKVTFVPDDKIAEENPGATIGIPGAPDALPTPANLVQTGWTACSDISGQTKLRIDSDPAARPAGRSALVVEAGGNTYVVAGEHRYVVPAEDRDATLRALGLDGQTARPVPGIWLDLFPPGQPLRPFAVEGSGEPVPASLSAPEGANRIGSTLRVDGRPYLLAADGLVTLSDFAYAMYRSGAPGADLPDATVEPGQIASLPASELDPYPEDWPEAAVTPYTGEAACVLLQTADDQAATVRLAVPTDESAAPAAGEGAERSVEVENGHGALVRATAGGVVDRGTVYVVDASGNRYAVGSPVSTTLERLGYADAAPAAVPLPWADLFTDGPVLDVSQAGRPAGAVR